MHSVSSSIPVPPPSAVAPVSASGGRSRSQQLTAIFEVLGVYIVGQLVGFIIGKLLGIPLKNPLTELTPSTTPAQLLEMTWHLFGILMLQYSGWLGVAFAVGWWHRRRTPRQYGVTAAGRPLHWHVVAGVVLFAVADFPNKLLGLVDTLLPLGEQAPWRETLLTMDWGTWEFWLFSAVGSYALIPVLEELFYRGYCQTRLEEDLGAPGAILAVAALFSLSHSQYHLLNVFNVTMLLTSFLGAVVWGYLFYRTRSLLPSIVAHALVNIPMRGVASWLLLVGMALACVVARREIAAYLREGLALLRGASGRVQLVALTVGFGLFAVGSVVLGDVVLLIALALLIAALVLEWRERRATARLSLSASVA